MASPGKKWEQATAIMYDFLDRSKVSAPNLLSDLFTTLACLLNRLLDLIELATLVMQDFDGTCTLSSASHAAHLQIYFSISGFWFHDKQVKNEKRNIFFFVIRFSFHDTTNFGTIEKNVTGNEKIPYQKESFRYGL